ncbi:elongation factor tu-like protein [Cyclospora cayetanensis]|uniref:Elongation factor tu-like protein n=1 Tax=Cyclospora cayetanensis TaxID=88456 RepID=A0A1D3D3L8_9EIME|nr:elongation factor tu-like protein [Cyclospora cayetanensis]
MVEQLVFEPIWRLYRAAGWKDAQGQSLDEAPTDRPQHAEDPRVTRLCTIAKALQLKETEQIAAEIRRLLSPARQRRAEESSKLKEELETLVLRVPNPIAAARQRLPRLCPHLDPFTAQIDPPVVSEGAPKEGPLQGAPPEDPLVIVYVAKFVAADLQSLRVVGATLQGNEGCSSFLGLCRIFVGCLRRGMRIFVCTEERGGPPPSGDVEGPLGSGELLLTRQAYVVDNIFLLFGPDLKPVKEASAGSVVAVSLLPADASADATQGAPREMLRDVAAWLQGLRSRGAPHHRQVEAQEKYTEEFERYRRGPMGVEGALRCSTLSNHPACPPLVSPYSKVKEEDARRSRGGCLECWRSAAARGGGGRGALILCLPASSAIVRVAVEAQRLEDSEKFIQGISRLFLADPSLENPCLPHPSSSSSTAAPFSLRHRLSPSLCVSAFSLCFLLCVVDPAYFPVAFLRTLAPQLSVLDNGELLLGCCGEVHLETSLSDLEALYARVPIRVSAPMTAIRETLAFASEVEAAQTASGIAAHTFSRRVAFPPWIPPPKGGVSEEETTRLEGFLAHTSAAPGDAPLEASLSAWIRKHRNYNSSVFWGGGSECPLVIVLRAEKMPDAVTDWLTANSRDLLATLKSRTPATRLFLHPQQRESGEGSETSGGACGLPPSASQDLLHACLRDVEASFSNTWRHAEKSPQNPPTQLPKAKAAEETFQGPPGPLWSLALSGGACCALLASSSLSVLFPEGCCTGKEPPASASAFRGTEGEEAPIGWAFEDASEISTLAANGVSGGLSSPLSRLLPALLAGFQRASVAGPLAEEPLRGVAFIVEALAIGDGLLGAPRRGPPLPASPRGAAAAAAVVGSQTQASAGASGGMGDTTESAPSSRHHAQGWRGASSTCTGVAAHPQLGTGQVISSMKEACRAAMLQRGLCRIYEAMLRFSKSYLLQTAGKQQPLFVGKLRDGGEGAAGVTSDSGFVPLGVLAGNMRFRDPDIEHDFFAAALPAWLKLCIFRSTQLRSEGYWQGLCGAGEEERAYLSKASGHAALQLQFSHWEVLQEDPFPEACMTEQELEDEGEAAFASLTSQIPARAIINSIRKSKGLPTEEKVVADAEKQRTLSRNK